MTAIRKHAKEALAVLGLIAVAAAVSVYILDNQRMRFPWEEAPLRLKAEFSTGQAVTPGQGQTVRVSGVRIGDIGAVGLRDGNAVVEMVIDREYEGMVRTGATALLRPRPASRTCSSTSSRGPTTRPRRRTASRSRSRRPRPTSTRTRSSPSSTPTRAATCGC